MFNRMFMLLFYVHNFFVCVFQESHKGFLPPLPSCSCTFFSFSLSIIQCLRLKQVTLTSYHPSVCRTFLTSSNRQGLSNGFSPLTPLMMPDTASYCRDSKLMLNCCCLIHWLQECIDRFCIFLATVPCLKYESLSGINSH